MSSFRLAASSLVSADAYHQSAGVSMNILHWRRIVASLLHPVAACVSQAFTEDGVLHKPKAATSDRLRTSSTGAPAAR